ncbi:serine/threonine-protein kinase [Nonomuraea sp. B19D2]|uniref:serine/threonine-protein kinase n=1 Tax=Nonomuraea sp. B19D2 TaxID=3159561 RepID=UPI0032DBA1AC
MGHVFLGTTLGGRRVAVKVIRPDLTQDPQFKARFAREIEAARKVNSFYTAPVVDADPPWMVTAYIPGPSLHSHVADHGPLPENALRRLGAGLAEGLLSVHAAGLVHRDLKPANVIMVEDGPRIIDFGIARAVDASALTAHGTIMGTFTYMSPEQVRGELAGPKSDVFSLACVLAFAATGHSRFEAPTLPAIVHRVLNTEPDLTGVPPSVCALIVHCLAKDQAGRPTVAAVLNELTQPAPARKASLPPATRVPSPRDTVSE